MVGCCCSNWGSKHFFLAIIITVLYVITENNASLYQYRSHPDLNNQFQTNKKQNNVLHIPSSSKKCFSNNSIHYIPRNLMRNQRIYLTYVYDNKVIGNTKLDDAILFLYWYFLELILIYNA